MKKQFESMLADWANKIIELSVDESTNTFIGLREQLLRAERLENMKKLDEAIEEILNEDEEK